MEKRLFTTRWHVAPLDEHEQNMRELDIVRPYQHHRQSISKEHALVARDEQLSNVHCPG